MSKNIYILPTDKFQNIKLSLFENKLYLGDIASTALPQHIYITSDEEIKEGDWTVFISTNEITKVPLGGFKGKVCQKIILTTDQDLIKDGVQAIDDEFLEWFVKNPSCEEVEVMNVPDFIYGTKHSCYKIIIPKEEHKQETVEEVAERLTKDFPHYSVRGNMDDSDIKRWFLEALQKGAKWQQERSYSEEEVGELLYNVIGEYGKHYGIMIDGKMLNDLFEQFKKK